MTASCAGDACESELRIAKLYDRQIIIRTPPGADAVICDTNALTKVRPRLTIAVTPAHIFSGVWFLFAAGAFNIKS